MCGGGIGVGGGGVLGWEVRGNVGVTLGPGGVSLGPGEIFGPAG